MESIWRKHLIICLFLGLLAIPIYFLDLALNKPGRTSGNWITLNFQGFIFWTYIALLATQVVLSSIAILSFSRLGALPIHYGPMPVFLILLVAGFLVKTARLGRFPSIPSLDAGSQIWNRRD